MYNSDHTVGVPGSIAGCGLKGAWNWLTFVHGLYLVVGDDEMGDGACSGYKGLP